MCGIAGGVRLVGEGPALSAAQIQAFLLENQYRGRDATGCGFVEEGRWFTVASPLPAREFLSGLGAQALTRIAAAPAVLLHTRAATLGDPSVRANNHPVVFDGWVVTHNGRVRNHAQVFERHAASGRRGPHEVDSVAINLVLAQGLDHLSTLVGEVTFAAGCASDPTILLLSRNRDGNAVYYSIQEDETGAVLLWSSIPDALPVARRFGIRVGPYPLDARRVLRVTRGTTVEEYELPLPVYAIPDTSTPPRSPISQDLEWDIKAPPGVFVSLGVARRAWGADPTQYPKEVIGTFLGRWFVDQAGAREFRPHRRVRLAYQGTPEAWWDQSSDVELPARPLVRVDLLSPAGESPLVGYGCPRCGIFLLVSTWAGRASCPWCDSPITQSPKEEGVA
jgi:hypothetical protein